MPSIEDYNRYGEELEKWFKLKTSPVAVKMLESEADIPEGAIRPKKDRGYHLAQCQAFGLSRRDRETIAMMKEDNWCPAPVMAYGMEPQPDDPTTRAMMKYDSFELGKYAGIVTAPLDKANFEPDVVIIYLNTAQLRTLLLAMKFEDRALIDSDYFPPSCAHAVVPPALTGRYHIVMPDPGEYARALCGEDEMMFAVPGDKLEGLVSDIRKAMESDNPFFNESMMMRPDFPQPDLYKHVFKNWGMDYDQ
jgi:uncharacterized protein (DUF169 family)